MSRIIVVIVAVGFLLQGCSEDSIPTYQSDTPPSYRILEFETFIKFQTVPTDSVSVQVRGRTQYSIKPAPLMGKTADHLYDVAIMTEATILFLNPRDSVLSTLRTSAISVERINLGAGFESSLIQRHSLEQWTMYLRFVVKEMELRFSRAWVDESPG